MYCVFAAFYFWLAAQIPYTHDDWDWGLDIGLHQFLHATVNSRYAGNFFVVIMTRSELLKTLIMGAGYFLIPYFLADFAAKRNPNTTNRTRLLLFLISNCLLLTMSRDTWRETYGWVSGYANFVISSLFMLPWVAELLVLFSGQSDSGKFHWFRLLILFLTCIISQLFIENLALFHVFLAVVLCTIHYLRNRTIPAKLLVMFLGAVIGLVIMFSSNLYDTLFSTGYAVGEYRQIPLLASHSVWEILVQLLRCATLLLAQLYARNTMVCILLVLTAMFLLQKHRDSIKPSHFKSAFNTNILTLLCLGGCILSNYFFGDNRTVNLSLHCLVSILFFFSITADLILIFRTERNLLQIHLGIWFSAPLLVAPLLITTESGSRLFFNSNIFLFLLLLSLSQISLTHLNRVHMNRLICWIAVVVSALMLYHSIIYTGIGTCKQTRDSIIEHSKTGTVAEITLPSYPYSDYLHHGNPFNTSRLQFFKEFYGIPDDVLIHFEAE